MQYTCSSIETKNQVRSMVWKTPIWRIVAWSRKTSLLLWVLCATESGLFDIQLESVEWTRKWNFSAWTLISFWQLWRQNAFGWNVAIYSHWRYHWSTCFTYSNKCGDLSKFSHRHSGNTAWQREQMCQMQAQFHHWRRHHCNSYWPKSWKIPQRIYPSIHISFLRQCCQIIFR